MTLASELMLGIGDSVLLPQGQHGILRWTGRIQGKPIEYAGVELTGPDAALGKHSGEYEGRKYFEVSKPGSGLFVSYSKLVSANVQTPLSRLGNSRLPALGPRRPPSAMRSPGRASPARAPTTNNDEVVKLRGALEDKDVKIKLLRQQLEDKRQEFRRATEILEADRNQMADHYEELIREMSQPQKGSDELDVQRTALAAMQNKLMEENEQMKQSLEIAEREAAEARAQLEALGGSSRGSKSVDNVDFEGVLAELASQEQRLAELQEVVQEVDDLRARNQELEERSAEMEAQLEEVVALKDSLNELTLAPTEDISKYEKEIATLKIDVEKYKKKAQKASQEAEEARKDAQMYFKMSDPTMFEMEQAKVKDLQARNNELEQELSKLKEAVAAKPARTSAGFGAPASKESTDRELEDKILRDAGLLPKGNRRQSVLPEGLSHVGVPEVPKTVPKDPAAGRELWCGLCERSGHTSIECPYD